MGGDGTIGGGRSMMIDINTKTRGGGAGPHWLLDDPETGPGTGPTPSYPFTLTFTFPPGTPMIGNTVTMTIRNRGDRVGVSWR